MAPLLGVIDLVDDPQRWGYTFRCGLFKASAHDMQRIAQAVRAHLSLPGLAPAEAAAP